MSKNSLIYIALWILIQLLIEISSFKPLERELHTATFINDKLYILSGRRDDKKQFFYLDVSISFNTQELLWHDLTDINIVPSHYGAASVNGGENNNTLFLYGGNSDIEKMDLVYTFNTETNSWNVLKKIGENIENIDSKRYYLTGIVNDRKMYLFGGYNGIEDINDMLILDTINFKWKKGSLVGAPSPREVYGATLLPNQHIIYFGK